MSIEKRERMRELGRRGGIASGKVRCRKIPAWKRALIAHEAALARWKHPPSSAVDPVNCAELERRLKLAFEVGFRVGTGWAP